MAASKKQLKLELKTVLRWGGDKSVSHQHRDRWWWSLCWQILGRRVCTQGGEDRKKGQAERCTTLLQELRRKKKLSEDLNSRRKLEESKHFGVFSFVGFCIFVFDFQV